MDDLTLRELKTDLVSDVAAALGFKSQNHFLKVWTAAGYRTFKPSPRKHVVLTSNVAKYLGERIVPLPKQEAANV
jgi:hypothetical protein